MLDASEVVSGAALDAGSSAPCSYPARAEAPHKQTSFEVGDLCRTSTMVILRAEESIFSHLITELPPHQLLRLLEVCPVSAGRFRACVEAGPLTGWITVLTSNGQPLIKRLKDTTAGVVATGSSADEGEKVLELRRAVAARDPNLLRDALSAARAEGVDAEALAIAEKVFRELEAIEELHKLHSSSIVADIQVAIATAKQLGLAPTAYEEADGFLASALQLQRCRTALTQVMGEVAEVNMGSLDDIQQAKRVLEDAVRAARAAGVEEAELREAELRRKRLHNAAEDVKGNIRVFCRIRPLSDRETQEDSIVTEVVDSMALALVNGRHDERFCFDAVFSPGSQQEVFEDCQDLVQSALDGYNITTFAYGQTGAGKTFTMYGVPGNEGIMQRMAREVFARIDAERNRFEATVTASIMELYQNEIVDLLAARPASPREWSPAKTGQEARRKSFSSASNKLAPQFDPKTGLVRVENLTEELCDTPETLLAVFERGISFRSVSATALNSKSSRSHLMASIRISRVNIETQALTQAKIMMCDLAGSERVKKSEAAGEVLREAIEINKSLSALGDVMAALTTQQKHIPYKNHKLTQLMQDAIGGTSKTLMLVNCSPASSNFEETQTALKYASRAKNCRPRTASRSR